MHKSEHTPHRIELNLREIGQLFNTMDPAPFPEKDLDGDAEEFIFSWVREFPLDEPVVLVVHLNEFPADQNPQPAIEQGVHHYFAYRARLNRMEFRQLLKEGRQTLIIGILFLADLPDSGPRHWRRRVGDVPQHRARKPDHRRLGGDVAADADLSLRLVAAAPPRQTLRQVEPDEGGGAQTGLTRITVRCRGRCVRFGRSRICRRSGRRRRGFEIQLNVVYVKRAVGAVIRLLDPNAVEICFADHIQFYRASP